MWCRKNRPSEDLPTPTAEAAVAAAASCSSTVADRSVDIETQSIVPQTSVDLERLCSSSCTPASYDEPIVELYSLEEIQPLTDDADDDAEEDPATSAIWIETAKTPPPSSPSSIVWRSRDLASQSDDVQPRRTSEVTVSSRSRWLTRSPAIELCQHEPPELECVELSESTATGRGDVGGRRVSGARLPNGIIPGTRSSSPPAYQSVWTQLQPVTTLTRPRSESNFAAFVSAPVAQRSNAAVERLRSLPPSTRSPAGGDDVTSATQRRRRRTVDLAPPPASSPSYVVSADDVNRSKLGRVSKEELYRMWKASERSLHAQLRVAMQQKAELQQRLQAAGLASAERLTVT